MQKKWHIWSRGESVTPLSKSAKKVDIDCEKAKQLYFANFANHMTMRKNGEYEEYSKYHISTETEQKWSREVRDKLVADIISGKDLLKVSALARINLPEREIIESFQLLRESSLCTIILDTIVQLKELIDPELFKRIIRLFS